MAIEKKRMRQRRGAYGAFDETKALPQELQVVTSGDPNTRDGKAVYIPIEIGDLRRIVTSDELDQQTLDVLQQVLADLEPTIKNTQSAATYANDRGQYACVQGQRAESAANTATAIAQDIIAMRDSGAFKGEQGPQGKQGVQGISGVVAPSAGMIALEVDSATGDLYAVYPETMGEIDFEYETDTGDLYVLIDDGA